APPASLTTAPRHQAFSSTPHTTHLLHLRHGWVTTSGAALDLTAVEFLVSAARGDAAMMSLHKLTAGDGYLYLVHQVAAADSTERGRSTLSDYYSAKGESPGRWVGSGL